LRLLLPDAPRVLREAPDRRMPGRQDHDPRDAQGHGAALRRAAAGRALLGIPPRRLYRTELRRVLRCLPLRAAGPDHAAPPRRAGGTAVTDRLWLRTVGGLFAGAFAAAAVILYLGISQRELVSSLHGVAEEPLFIAAGCGVLLARMGSRLVRRGPRWLTNLRDGFAANRWKRLLLVETVIAPLPWLWETFVIAVAGHALGLDLSAMQAFAALTAFNVATAVPSPGNAGSFEAGGTLALIAFGIPKEAALAFIFLYHLTQVVPGFVGGVLVLVLEGETLFGRQSLFRFRRPELPEVGP